MSVLSLPISFNGRDVGLLTYDSIDEAFALTYSENWQKSGFAISPHMPLDKAVHPSVLRRYLKNLLPEGNGLEELANYLAVSKNNTFGLLRSIGLDLSGAMVFGTLPEEMATSFRLITEEELEKRIESGLETITIWDGKMRLSVAGVQVKLPVMSKSDGTFGIGEGKYASTHIMKFEKRPKSHLVLNEFFCMRLAKAAGLGVADVALKRVGKFNTLMVKRFDREVVEDGVERLHVIDGCQLLDLPPHYKYERVFGAEDAVKDHREGASFQKLFATADSFTSKLQLSIFLIRWAIYSLIIGNADAHGKNVSFFLDEYGLTPAPLYDLLAVAMHITFNDEEKIKEIDQELAMAFGDEFELDAVKAYDLIDFARSCGIAQELVIDTARALCSTVTASLDLDLNIELSDEEELFLDGLRAFITKRIHEVNEAVDGMKDVTY